MKSQFLRDRRVSREAKSRLSERNYFNVSERRRVATNFRHEQTFGTFAFFFGRFSLNTSRHCNRSPYHAPGVRFIRKMVGLGYVFRGERSEHLNTGGFVALSANVLSVWILAKKKNRLIRRVTRRRFIKWPPPSSFRRIDWLVRAAPSEAR